MADGNGAANGAWRDEFIPVWDAVCVAYPKLIAHVNGTQVSQAIGLTQVVRAFHEQAVFLQRPIGPGELASAFLDYPNGPFFEQATHGSAGLLKELKREWDSCIADRLKKNTVNPTEVQLSPAIISEIREIPPRPWAYGRFLMFGVAGVIGAMDGAGKGMLAVSMLLSFITGRDLLGEKVWRKGTVAIISYEDDQDEWRRRIAAACILHELDYTVIIRSVFFLTKPAGPVVLAQPGGRGEPAIFPDHARIVLHLNTIKAVALLVDPFNNAHAMEDGNSNVAIATVAQEISTIAREAHVTALVLHHLRKGAQGNVDDLMGAVALRANFRSCRILQVATDEDAAALGLPPGEAWRYLSVVGSKENYAPPLLERMWFTKKSLQLHNPAGIYELGDEVGAIERWKPPPLFEGLDHETLRIVFTAIAASPHAENKRVTALPWVGQPLIDVGRTDAQATAICKLWLKDGVLIKGEPFTGEDRKEKQTLTIDPIKVAAILGARGRPPEADYDC